MKRILYALAAVALTAIPACTSSDANPVVEIDTSMGKIKVELYQEKAPITVKNFLRYVDEKHYDGQIHFPPRHVRLHDSGRRFRARHEGTQGHAHADPERGFQWCPE